MAIKPIDAPTGIDIVRAATATAANSRNSQRPPARSPEASSAASPPQTQQQAQQLQAAQQQLPASAAQRPGAQAPPAQLSPNMRIHVDQDTGKTVVAIVNPEDGAILRQMPSQEALQVAKAIGRYQGMFVDLKV
jgi:flagellar protein FlaG